MVGLPIQTRSPQLPRYYDPAHFRDHQQRVGASQHRPCITQRLRGRPRCMGLHFSMNTLSLSLLSAPPADMQFLHLFIQDGMANTVCKYVGRVLFPGYFEDIDLEGLHALLGP